METKNCESCRSCVSNDNPKTVSFVIYESAMARAEKKNKRLFYAFIVSICFAFLSNIAWLIYESQFETLTYEQDGDGINNINYGEQGDIINNESANQNESSQERSS